MGLKVNMGKKSSLVGLIIRTLFWLGTKVTIKKTLSHGTFSQFITHPEWPQGLNIKLVGRLKILHIYL